MALVELHCKKCGFKDEFLIKSDGNYPLCPECKTQLTQCYSGKCYGSVKNSACGGNCATCGGCKK